MKEKLNTFLTTSPEEVPDADEAADIAVIEQMVDEDTRARLMKIQAQKQDFVAGLNAWRKKFWIEPSTAQADSVESFEKQDGAFELQQDDDGSFFTRAKGGAVFTLSKGEVLAAGEWGVWWKFANSVSEDVQKEVMSHQVRRVIAEEYDAQLTAFGKANTLLDDHMRDTYTRIEEQNRSLNTMPPGILAERMLLSFLTKEMHDGELEFSIERADVYEDVERKIDFIITVADHRRGVEVDEPNHHQRIGIQFTTSERSDLNEHKTKQIKRVHKIGLQRAHVDDLVLISLPIAEVEPSFEAWYRDDAGNARSERKRDPRGPDALWSDETKQAIIDALITNINVDRTTTLAAA